MDPVRVLESGRGAPGAANFGSTRRGPHDGSSGPQAVGRRRLARGRWIAGDGRIPERCGCRGAGSRPNREPDQSRRDG